jgi:transcriptional regulator with XRE-family HTH domain
MAVSFGDLVRRGREDAGLSQSRLATLIGKSPTTIRAWEHGRTHPSDPGAVAALAAVLGLDEAELLGRAGFDAPAARTRLSAREELSNLAG